MVKVVLEMDKEIKKAERIDKEIKLLELQRAKQPHPTPYLDVEIVGWVMQAPMSLG